jgi:hypothetical protein
MTHDEYRSNFSRQHVIDESVVPQLIATHELTFFCFVLSKPNKSGSQTGKKDKAGLAEPATV